MRLWQLSLLIWGALAAAPVALHAIGRVGASPLLRTQCAATTDPVLRSGCQELGL